MGEKWTLAEHPWDNTKQILIVIPFKWRLARWWMGASLPLCRALERVFNMTIKCMFFRFYCICLSLSSEPPSSSSVFYFPLTLSLLFPSLPCPNTSSVQCSFCTIKWRLQFSPSQSTYLCFMTHSKSILCWYWFSSLCLLPFCLNRRKPFCLADSPNSSADLKKGKRKREEGILKKI